MWVSEMVDFACQLETDLIDYYKTQQTLGRYNIRGGGDNPPKFGPCFVYCVFGFGPYGGSSARVRELAARRREQAALRPAPLSPRAPARHDA